MLTQGNRYNVIQVWLWNFFGFVPFTSATYKRLFMPELFHLSFIFWTCFFNTNNFIFRLNFIVHYFYHWSLLMVRTFNFTFFYLYLNNVSEYLQTLKVSEFLEFSLLSNIIFQNLTGLLYDISGLTRLLIYNCIDLETLAFTG